jgi:hypothetical protein
MNQLVRATRPASVTTLIAALDRNALVKKAQRVSWLLDPTWVRPPPDELCEAITSAEVIVADPRFAALARDLKLLLAPPTAQQINHEVLQLLLCFRTRSRNDEDEAEFVEIAVEDIADIEALSILSLIVGCRELRREAKFPPSIAEILSAIRCAFGHDMRADAVVRLPERLEKAKQRLAIARNQ